MTGLHAAAERGGDTEPESPQPLDLTLIVSNATPGDLGRLATFASFCLNGHQELVRAEIVRASTWPIAVSKETRGLEHIAPKRQTPQQRVLVAALEAHKSDMADRVRPTADATKLLLATSRPYERRTRHTERYSNDRDILHGWNCFVLGELCVLTARLSTELEQQLPLPTPTPWRPGRIPHPGTPAV